MIPKIISIVWVGPHLPPTEMIDSWAKKHSEEWLILPWKDHTGWQNQEQINARARRNEWNGVADCMRYEILYKFGGFAVDADSECLKALDAGPEDFLSSDTALAAYESELVRPGIIGCGFLGAPKGHPFFKACIDEVATQDPGLMAWKAVGPQLMGRVTAKMPNDIKVVPAKLFNPVHYTGTKAAGDQEPYASQGWGSTKSYNPLRKRGCTCAICAVQMIRCPWG